MRRLIWLALAAFAGFAGGCADHKYSPFSFQDFPGCVPPGSRAAADPHRSSAGYAP